MSDTIKIDGKRYLISSLPPKAMHYIQVMQAAQAKRTAALVDLQIAEHAVSSVADVLSKELEGVEPIAEPEINTGKAAPEPEEE